ncbi:MAG TPA: hypothetical protein P5556_06115 [Candidatus Gastranaerophilales bacterium]|nr:hypothetical protein [Candidatus Gastranaerophilales bacterium]
MLKKIRIIIVFVLILNLFSHFTSAQVINLSSSKNISPVEGMEAEVYKPSRLITGAETGFIVKAEPGTNVVIIFSEENKGMEPYYGQSLRLGVLTEQKEAIVGENGLAEIKISLPEEKELVGKLLYFEAIVWKKEDLSDVTKAKIIGANGLQTDVNAVMISRKPGKKVMPGFGPGIPGGRNLYETLDAVSDQDTSEKDYLYSDEMYYRSMPLMIRNLRAPELKKEQEKQEKQDINAK